MEVFLKTQTLVLPRLFTGRALKTQFLMGNELRRGEEKEGEPTKVCRATRLMPTVEAVESLWEMSACISRGIKENMQRKSQWKDKCVGTL